MLYTEGKNLLKKFARITLVASLIVLSMPLMFTAQVQAWVGPVLFAGVSNPASVYRYDGTSWTLIGTFAEEYAVLSLVEYECVLYAGTMSAYGWHDNVGSIGRVYRYDGGTTWTMVGDNMDAQVACLEVYDGSLYAGTAWGQGRLYRYDGGTTWTMVVDYTGPAPPSAYDWQGFRSAYVWGGLLRLGDIMHHNFGHYDGITFTHDAHFGYCEGIYDYEVHGEYLYAASGESARLYRSSDGTTWSDFPSTVIGYQGYLQMWELETFGGYLYMSLSNGTLQRWDGSSHSNVWSTSEGEGIISMEASLDFGNLFLGIGGEAGAYYGSSSTGTGRVYSYDGTTFQLISGDMGTGVQVLYATPTLPTGVIPEVPLGTIMISAAMIIALVAYVAKPKWRRKQTYATP